MAGRGIPGPRHLLGAPRSAHQRIYRGDEGRYGRTTRASFKGEFVNFNNVIVMPKPTRDIPIAVGGESLPALRRVAAFGNAWYGYSLTPEQLAEKLRKLEQLLAANHRRLDEIEIIVHPPKRPSLDEMKKYPRTWG